MVGHGRAWLGAVGVAQPSLARPCHDGGARQGMVGALGMAGHGMARRGSAAGLSSSNLQVCVLAGKGIC